MFFSTTVSVPEIPYSLTRSQDAAATNNKFLDKRVGFMYLKFTLYNDCVHSRTLRLPAKYCSCIILCVIFI